MKCINKKIDQEFFEDVCDGTKTFEIGKNEDKIEVGDYILFQETEGRYSSVPKSFGDPIKVQDYTGRGCLVKVIYILKDYPGLKKGYAIYGIKKIKEE